MTQRKETGVPQFDIDIVAAHLEACEETIVFKLADRAQYFANLRIYREGESGFKDEKKRSLFHTRLLFQERMDAQFGRFCVPEERPFFSRLPRARRAVHLPQTGLRLRDNNAVNLMRDIVAQYLALVPRICREGEDGHFGSSVEHDIFAVQAIALRVHYGALYVAESKFRIAPEKFTPLIRDGDAGALVAALTRKEVEERILRRIPEKVAAAQKNANPMVRHCIDPGAVAAFYRETIMPLTKQGQAIYLLHRLDA